MLVSPSRRVVDPANCFLGMGGLRQRTGYLGGLLDVECLRLRRLAGLTDQVVDEYGGFGTVDGSELVTQFELISCSMVR